MLEFSDVSAGYGENLVLSAVDLSLDPGITVLLGPNGSGKTTLFRVGAGILPPRSGSVTFDGRSPHENPMVKSQLKYVPHTPTLYRDLTVTENMKFWCRLHGIPSDRRDDRIRELSDQLDFTDLLTTNGGELSRGQSQRVSLGIGLLAEPDVLFLDEPSSGLDRKAATKLYDLLTDLTREDRVILYATHDLHEADRLADDIALMNEGEIVGYGPKERMKASVDDDETVELDLVGSDIEPTLSRLGYEATKSGDYWDVTLPAGTDITDLVMSFAEEGIEVHDIRSDESGLARVYDGIR